MKYFRKSGIKSRHRDILRLEGGSPRKLKEFEKRVKNQATTSMAEHIRWKPMINDPEGM